jgi:GT2 family glycosyltransferase
VSLDVPVIVVDNGSSDGSVEALRALQPSVRVVPLAENHGAAARNIGVDLARTPYVAFADDDSWWAPGSLERAAGILDSEPTVALVAARTLVGARELLDPLSQQMEDSPLGRAAVSGARRILGFAACAVVVRRAAFIATDGFLRRFVVGGEEEIVALDLRTAGWQLVYAPDVVAHHHPEPRAGSAQERRRRVITRNALWTAWLRYPWSLLLAVWVAALFRAVRDRQVGWGVLDALAGVGSMAVARRPVRGWVAEDLYLLQGGPRPRLARART